MEKHKIMFTKMEQEFEAWKKKTGYKPVNEGFLDDEETTPTDSLTIADEPEDKPDEEAEGDLLGDEEKVGTDGGEEPANAPADSVEDDGVSKTTDEKLAELADQVSNMATTFNSFMDMMKQKEEKEAEEEPAEEPGSEFDDLDLGGGDDEPTDGGEEETTDGGDEEPAEEPTEEAESGDSADGGESTEGDGGNDEGGEEEYSGDDESDETKSEAYNHYMKHGQLLNSNSGSIIGPIESGKYWKIDESVLTLAKLKIRQKIEEKKREIRTKILEASEGFAEEE